MVPCRRFLGTASLDTRAHCSLDARAIRVGRRCLTLKGKADGVPKNSYWMLVALCLHWWCMSSALEAIGEGGIHGKEEATGSHVRLVRHDQTANEMR
eukprot:6175601-Pleurochrysis_carterae.AAC.7